MLYIHDQLIEETGGSHGMRDLNGLQAAIGRPQSGFGDTEFYPDVFLKAAALMSSLVSNHPFVDGNKRTCITAAGISLEENQWCLVASNQELEDFTASVAVDHLDVDDIADWLRDNCRPPP